MLFGLVPLLTSGIFTVITYRDQVDRFEVARSLDQQRLADAFSGLMAKSELDLSRLAQVITTFGNMQQALSQQSASLLKRAFDPHWPMMQLEMGVDVARFYDREGGFLAGWSIQGASGVLSMVEEERWVRRVLDTESPASLLDCVLNCLRYGLVPLLADGRTVGVVVLGTSLADVILSFRQITGVDVGVMVPGAGVGGSQSDRVLSAWNFKVVALTDPATNLEVLRAVAANAPPPRRSREVSRVQVSGRDFEVTVGPMSGFSGDTAGYLVMVDEISDDLAAIDRARYASLVVGGVGLLLSELLLLALLWRPMSRLRRTAGAIPLLGEGAFKRVRETLGGHGSRGIVDEIDLLDTTAVALADQLESLENDVRHREQELNHSVADLRREKNFVQGLLETAQVIIATQDYRGHITMLNRFGEQVTGYSREELIGESMVGRLFPPDTSEVQRHAFSELLKGNREHIKQEMPLVCRDGPARYVAWFHSRVPGSLGGKGRILSVGLDVTEARRQEQRIRYQADHDTLTGLYNRRRFQEELDRLLASAVRHGKGGSLLFLDIDQFKFVNDTRGHQAGDTLLRTVSEELQLLGGESGVLGRLGGDEFSLVVPGIDEEEAAELARNVTRSLAGLRLPGGHGDSLSVSIGIVLYPKHGTSTYDLLVNADVAMHQAKDLGRGHWHLFSPDEQARERLRQRAQWVTRIERALTSDNLVLVFQPIMHIVTRNISHYEVLVRMRLPDGQLYPPGAFIPLAEDTGLIRPLDNLVVKKAIARLAEELKTGRDVRFAVNLSGRTMEDPDLVDNLRGHLKRFDVDPQRLIFEVTETAAVADLRLARQLVEGVRELGCRFALDDFGVGFSSFSYLKELPADYVKIDGSFIKNLAHSRYDQVITKALGQVASGFGKRTIAEFVQDDETIELLHKYGIDYAQGYYIGKPSLELLDSDVFSPPSD